MRDVKLTEAEWVVLKRLVRLVDDPISRLPKLQDEFSTSQLDTLAVIALKLHLTESRKGNGNE